MGLDTSQERWRLLTGLHEFQAALESFGEDTNLHRRDQSQTKQKGGRAMGTPRAGPEGPGGQGTRERGPLEPEREVLPLLKRMGPPLKGSLRAGMVQWDLL